MNIRGCFLLIGPDIEPCTSLIGEASMQRLNDRLALASLRENDRMRHHAYRVTFHIDAHWAIPCWEQAAMIAIANDYRGKDEARVRGLAARIALGQPYGADESRGNGSSDGGQRVTTDPVKPKPRKPSGGNRVQIAAERSL